MNEVRGLSLAGLPNESILRMATVDAAGALGIHESVTLVVEEGRIVYRK